MIPKFIKIYYKEILTYAATFIAWYLITDSLVILLDNFQIYKISLAIFLITFSIGFKPLLFHIVYGLYNLITEE